MAYYDRNYGSSRDYSLLWSGIKIVAIGLGVVAIIVGVFLAISDNINVFGAWLLNNVWLAWYMPGGIGSATPWFWVSLVFIVLVIFTALKHRNDSIPFWWIWGVFLSVSAVFLIWTAFLVQGNQVKYLTQDDGIQYIVDDVDKVPQTLEVVDNSYNRLIGITGVNEENEIPTEWTSREDVNPRTNAVSRLDKASDTMPRAELMPETVQLMFSADEPAWTGIIDRTTTHRGPLNTRYIAGVGVYKSDGTVDTCQYGNSGYELHRHFGGMLGKNLYDDIAQHNPRFIYNDADMYGYCEDGNPVIAIPGMRMVAWQHQTVLEPYGLLTIKGSASGEPIFALDTEITPDEYPGPVYPAKLVDQQRGALEWTIGNPWFNAAVGYQPAQSIIDEMGMDTNNLVRDSDGRLYYSTPLVPIGNDKSQLAIAISLVPADELKSGQMNPHLVRVFDAGDPRVTDMSLIRGIVEDRIKVKEDAFFSSANEDNQGKVTDMTLLSIDKNGTTWQIIASSGDRPRYMVVVSGNTTLKAEIFELDELGNVREDTAQGDNGEPSVTLDCNDLSGLSNSDVVKCVNRALTELEKRASATE